VLKKYLFGLNIPPLTHLGTLGLFMLVLLFAACDEQQQQTQVVPKPQSEITTLNDTATLLSDLPSNATGAYLCSRLAFSLNDFPQAAKCLEHAYSLDTSNGVLGKRLLITQIYVGATDAAMTLAGRVKPLLPNDPLPSLLLHSKAMRGGNWALASQDPLIIGSGGLPFIYPLLEAWGKVAENQAGAGVDILEKAKQHHAPLQTLFSLHQGLIWQVAGDNVRALEAMEKAYAQMDSTTLRFASLYGAALDKQNNQEQLNKLLEALSQDIAQPALVNQLKSLLSNHDYVGLQIPQTAQQGIAQAYFDIASLLQDDRNNESSVIFSRLALYLWPDFDYARILLGNLLEADRHATLALGVYEQITSERHFSWVAMLRAAAMEMSLEQPQKATERLNYLIRLNPELGIAHQELADLYREQQQWTSAISAYTRAIQLLGSAPKATDWRLFYGRGIAYERAQEWVKAEQDFLQALALSPDEPYVLNYLGYSWVEQGINLDRAQKMLEKAVSLRPMDGYIVDSYGWVQYRLGKWPEAVTWLERAIALKPSDPTINDHLGDAYWQVGRTREAGFQWQRALDFKPEPKDIAAIEQKILNGLPSVSIPLGDAAKVELGKKMP
jgi:tetratricopeptide (TPR) repeat protein